MAYLKGDYIGRVYMVGAVILVQNISNKLFATNLSGNTSNKYGNSICLEIYIYEIMELLDTCPHPDNDHLSQSKGTPLESNIHPPSPSPDCLIIVLVMASVYQHTYYSLHASQIYI